MRLILAAVWLLAGDADVPPDPAGPVPARISGDPAPPELPPVPDRGPQNPQPLVTESSAHAAGSVPPIVITRADMRRISILPSASLASGILVPLALGTRGGDWGTPAVEMLAGYGGGYAGTIGAVALTGAVEALGPRPDPAIGFNRGAAWVALVGIVFIPPAAAGAATFWAGEGMQGRSRHRTENLWAAMGGALATEIAIGATAIALKQPPGPALTLAFIPMAAGATLAYDLARGPHRGPRRAVLPLVISGRF